MPARNHEPGEGSHEDAREYLESLLEVSSQVVDRLARLEQAIDRHAEIMVAHAEAMARLQQGNPVGELVSLAGKLFERESPRRARRGR